MGLIYVLRASDGKLKEGFPVKMHEVQAQVVAADLNGDGILELVAVDMVGSIAAWSASGSLQWQVHLSGLSVEPVTVASLRGDGTVQVVVATAAGVVHVLDGQTGREDAPFPLRAGGKIMSSVLVIELQIRSTARAPGNRALDSRQQTAPHLVFSSFDGFLYIVHATSGCVHKVDIGEHSYTQILADDLTGNGRMDLLLSTMNGNMYCFETNTPHNPLRAWRSQAQGYNVFSPRESFMGVAIDQATGRHVPLAISGVEFTLSFSITDMRKLHTDAALRRRYEIKVGMGAHVLFQATYKEPGIKHVFVPCPHHPTSGVLTVSMVNEHGQYFEDRIAISFNKKFSEVIKWVALLPYMVTTLVILASTLRLQPAALPM